MTFQAYLSPGRAHAYAKHASQPQPSLRPSAQHESRERLSSQQHINNAPRILARRENQASRTTARMFPGILKLDGHGNPLDLRIRRCKWGSVHYVVPWSLHIL
ncbi:hypothetical protein SNOG_07732 [Parastagonospora nodorum SN15]|uniref:Uncharacterized protein n=1 Tax=Phaeosphaeria nodorum (strain SN15 / ATCC MYA-4574 / FGSC 10173) TaxID=321614 RepID=Q0UKI2_PHANO|nr:hypothetical protein SNOG_07732 [Parastagonospora nodorum SN15]EAT85198.1 hypothetical protein SNOG_07732 [Parastagonospora nodorum SN15]